MYIKACTAHKNVRYPRFSTSRALVQFRRIQPFSPGYTARIVRHGVLLEEVLYLSGRLLRAVPSLRSFFLFFVPSRFQHHRRPFLPPSEAHKSSGQSRSGSQLYSRHLKSLSQPSLTACNFVKPAVPVQLRGRGAIPDCADPDSVRGSTRSSMR